MDDQARDEVDRDENVSPVAIRHVATRWVSFDLDAFGDAAREPGSMPGMRASAKVMKRIPARRHSI
jgi:hypothetical protein